MKNYYENISTDGYEELLCKLKDSLSSKQKQFIITANSEIFMGAGDNKDIDEMLKNKNNIVLADGISIVKTARYFGIDIKNRIPGVELCETLLNYCSDSKYKVYVYGCKKEVLDKLHEKYQSVNFVGLKDGYDNKPDEVTKDIIKCKPDLVIAALGVPRQELFLHQLSKKIGKGILIGVGGSIDVISGCKKRAPKFFRKLNLEWLYRIMIEPKRIKRFYNNNVKLLFVAKSAAKKEKNNEN